MKFSFIIASINRDEELQKCIISIERAYEYRKDIEIEILVVFQCVDKNKTIKTKYPEVLFMYYIDKIGLSVARNFAIKKSRGEYLIFIDDDAMIKEDFIDILSKNVNEANALCGKIIDPINSLVFSRFLNAEKKSLNRFDFRYFMGSSHVLKKSIFEEIGLYDESFGVGSKYHGAEESDVFFRLLRKNKQVLYIPDLVFFHSIPNKTPVSKVFNNAYAVGAMLTKQAIIDKKNFFVYAFLILEILSKSLVRTIQNYLFVRDVQVRNERLQYYSIGGTIQGILGYFRE